MEALGKINCKKIIRERMGLFRVDQSLLSISRSNSFLLMKNISKSTACTAKIERKSIVKYRKRNKSNSIAEAELTQS